MLHEHGEEVSLSRPLPPLEVDSLIDSDATVEPVPTLHTALPRELPPCFFDTVAAEEEETEPDSARALASAPETELVAEGDVAHEIWLKGVISHTFGGDSAKRTPCPPPSAFFPCNPAVLACIEPPNHEPSPESALSLRVPAARPVVVPAGAASSSKDPLPLPPRANPRSRFVLRSAIGKNSMFGIADAG